MAEPMDVSPSIDVTSDVEADAYKQALLQRPDQVVSVLRDTLGAGMVARLAGVSETRAVHQWAAGSRAVRSNDAEARLRLAYQAVSLVAGRYSPEVAARWFNSPCPWLDYSSPSSLLAGASADEVGSGLMAAAREFLHREPGGEA